MQLTGHERENEDDDGCIAEVEHSGHYTADV